MSFDGELVRFGAQVQNADVNDPVVQQVMDDVTSTGAGVVDGEEIVDVNSYTSIFRFWWR